MPRQARPQDLRNQVRAASWDGRHRYTPTAFAASRTISSGGTSRRCLYTPTVTERVDELPAPLLPERAGGRVEHVAPASVAFEGTVYVLGLDLQGQIGAAQGQRGHDALIRELPGKALPYRDVWHA